MSNIGVGTKTSPLQWGFAPHGVGVCGVVLIVVVVCSWGVRVVSVLVDDGALSSGIAGLRGAVSDLSRAFAPDCSGVGDPSVVGSCAALVACLESSRVSLADRADALRGYLGTVRDSTDALDARLAGSADGIAGTAPLAGSAGPFPGPAGPLDGLACPVPGSVVSR